MLIFKNWPVQLFTLVQLLVTNDHILLWIQTTLELGFDQASLGLNREYLLKGFEDEIVQQYFKYMLDAAVVLGANPETAKEELKESLLFEIEMANITTASEDRRNATTLYNPTTLGEFLNSLV